MAYIYKPIRKIIYSNSLFFLDIIFVYVTLWLIKYLKISNYVILKVIISCICVLFAVNIGKKFLKLYILKNGMLLSYFSGIALGVIALPYNNPMPFGFCCIIYGIYSFIKMKEFNIDEYANQYDKIESRSYYMSKYSKNVGIYLYAPGHILMGIIAIGFGIKEIIETIL